VTRHRFASILALGLLLAGCSVFRTDSVVRDGWRWPEPAPLPAGAKAVALDVSPIISIPADAGFMCPLALFLPFTIHHVPGDAAQPVHYRQVSDGAERPIRWQHGVSARVTDKLEIVGPDGEILASEGVPVEGLGGGTGNDGISDVCIGKYLPTRVTQ
jgi:hypothetical protein